MPRARSSHRSVVRCLRCPLDVMAPQHSDFFGEIKVKSCLTMSSAGLWVMLWHCYGMLLSCSAPHMHSTLLCFLKHLLARGTCTTNSTSVTWVAFSPGSSRRNPPNSRMLRSWCSCGSTKVSAAWHRIEAYPFCSIWHLISPHFKSPSLNYRPCNIMQSRIGWFETRVSKNPGVR